MQRFVSAKFACLEINMKCLKCMIEGLIMTHVLIAGRFIGLVDAGIQGGEELLSPLHEAVMNVSCDIAKEFKHDSFFPENTTPSLASNLPLP